MDIKEHLKDQKYTKAYSETKLFEKILKFAKAAGIKIIYIALILYYTLQKSTTPMWAKSMIVGALGYFILPIDFIPDFIPFVGYTDDLSALAGALVAVAMYVDEEVKQKSKEKLNVWFGKIDATELKSVDKKIKKQDSLN
ncbi:MAG: hypothetical protein CVU96_06795 [Firmicutes bacterium HGW-Firmicutes-20]|jgi:uncharacterized membrane protein YkvA (DUF1232 family)|nr:MAG: hypothetical protein CVU96_06795 [Firmicutes bacterium HGW-Firmicutes-20]PKM69988.1 MAG: hypothetical protein CVU94_01360 [Firmicutes bacterium HGW-Firmicutes-19]